MQGQGICFRRMAPSFARNSKHRQQTGYLSSVAASAQYLFLGIFQLRLESLNFVFSILDVTCAIEASLENIGINSCEQARRANLFECAWCACCHSSSQTLPIDPFRAPCLYLMGFPLTLIGETCPLLWIPLHHSSPSSRFLAAFPN